MRAPVPSRSVEVQREVRAELEAQLADVHERLTAVERAAQAAVDAAQERSEGPPG